MNLTERSAVLNALERFAGNYRIANGEQEIEKVNYWAYGFIDSMTLDETERQDFREIYKDKTGIRDRAIASVQ
ncbi:MAG TPA: hypothetical protein VJ438_01700 [Candidatus Nanoarchaeia archaeon]|nr:hypothetical protein [Candidatus Nanoarchaeia archaeon]